MRKQEITASSNPVTRAPVPAGMAQGFAGDDFWASNALSPAPAGGGAGGALGAANQPQPFRKIHRLLRGRYVIMIPAVLICAAFGAIIGWKSSVPLYVSNGLVEVKPVLSAVGMMDKAIPYYQAFVRTQAMKVASTRVINEALKSSEWTSVAGDGARNLSPEFVAAFQQSLTATYVRDSQLIQISVTHENPKLAAAGCNAVMQAYSSLSEADSAVATQDRALKTQQARDRAALDMRNLEGQMTELYKDYGSANLAPMLMAKQEQKLKLETDLMRISLTRQMAEGTTAGLDGKHPAAPKLTPDQIATVDQHMKQLLMMVDQAYMNESALKATTGAEAPKVKQAEIQLQNAVEQVNLYYADASKRYTGLIPSPDGTNVLPVTPDTIAMLKNNEVRLNDQIHAIEEQIQALGQVTKKIDDYQRQAAKAKDEVDKYDKQLEALNAQLASTGLITQLGRATEPMTADIDKRKQTAMVGLVVGGGIPFAVALLLGILDSRYRYSDEAGEHSTGMNTLPLLGILPNLPDRLSDPAQASIAAHCVHQIRTMLQLNTADDRRCFTVTSATSGDGKTSLTLALGLSFAASGSRTLLIDADLVGAGLTGRLGMSGPEGILEAMTSGHLLNYVRSTDVADLSILPVGMAQLHHAGIFSPAAVRRLVTEARKHFEIILIDTGPILGSIEATPVAAASDGVILTVARGQSRPMVEKALSHLRSIGAVVAGVVFNRAQARDFEQSISGISMRSAARSGTATAAGTTANGSNGNGHNHNRAQAGQYGPVAKAVASSVKPEKN